MKAYPASREILAENTELAVSPTLQPVYGTPAAYFFD